MNGLLDDFKNVWSKPNNALIQIIVINILVFVVVNATRVILNLSGAGGAAQFLMDQLMLPADFGNFLSRPWTLVTYFFTHQGFFHILFNMLFLYWFGKLIVEYIGSRRLVALYVIGGLAGGIFYMLMYNFVPFFQERVSYAVMLGASAGVYAVVVGAATLMPNFTFFLLLLGPVRIKYIALFFVVLSFFQSDGANAGGELAHLAGALIGFIFIKQLQSGTDIGKPVYAFLNFIEGLFKKRSKIKVTYRNEAKEPRGFGSTTKVSTPRGNDPTDIDAILDKISARGYESLTKEEKQRLFNASKK
jgi:membrane associated rhomboid family serine protease